MQSAGPLVRESQALSQASSERSPRSSTDSKAGRKEKSTDVSVRGCVCVFPPVGLCTFDYLSDSFGSITKSVGFGIAVITPAAGVE